MRIVLVTHYFAAHRGGIELVAAELAARLARQGAEIAWHASDSDPSPQIPGVSCVPARACNAIERRLGVPYPLWSIAALRRLAAAVRAADVVHLHDCLYLPHLVAYAAARRAGKPVVVTQHVGMVPYRNPLLRALLFVAYRVLGRALLGGASQVVFVGEGVKRYFESFVRFRRPPLLIANGVDTKVFHPPQQRAPNPKPQLLFVGRFVEKKGLPLLRELAARLPQAQWTFAGWGPLDPEDWKLPNVRVLRNLTGRDLVPLYQAADLLVLPSVGEGFPLVVQEAMACGTPALVSEETAAGAPQAPLLKEQLELERWVARIQNASEWSALRPKVAEFAREHWSWERCAQRYASLLRLDGAATL
jgi:glycosyltransferase involved in cell wall biosynthesis